MIALIVIMLIKEATLFIGGCFVLKKTDTINSAKWYGKLSTFVMYSTMTLLFLLYDVSPVFVNICIVLCAIALVGSTILYARFYYSILKKQNSTQEKNN
jgi:cardiolipin synthase